MDVLPIKQVLTEEELPRGKMMLIGRRHDGAELATMIDPLRLEIVPRQVEALERALKYGHACDVEKIREILES